jgi:hypothetical protein
MERVRGMQVSSQWFQLMNNEKIKIDEDSTIGGGNRQ